MDTFYGYETAIAFWRLAAPRGRMPRIVTRMPNAPDYARTSLAELAHRPNWLDPELIEMSGGIVHSLVFHRGTHISTDGHRWHLWNRVPEASFAPAGENSFVATPEFCFLQTASVLDIESLIMLGMELCGSYRLDQRDERGFASGTLPLTSCERIADYLEQSRGMPGYRKASQALKYLVNRSNSPMETAVAMMLHLPYKYGGYGLPTPELNSPIPLNDEARKLHNVRTCYGDICWPEALLDLEYLGDIHEGKANMRSDRSRTLAIQEMGFQVIEITQEQVEDLGAFDILARRIATILGKRLRPDKLGAIPERRRLQAITMPSEIASASTHVFEEYDLSHDEPDEDIVFGAWSKPKPPNKVTGK